MYWYFKGLITEIWATKFFYAEDTQREYMQNRVSLGELSKEMHDKFERIVQMGKGTF